MKLLLALACAGCLGPLVSDDPALDTSTTILAAGTAVPLLTDDPVAAAKIAAADGLTGTLVRQTAFARGTLVHVWNVGTAPNLAAPLFMLVKKDGNGTLVRVPHPTVIEAIPGDPGYSPFWAVFEVEITTAYNGELLTSFAAIQEALAKGLIAPPIAQTYAVNCPIAGPDVRLDVGNGATVGPNAQFYYRGSRVPYFDFGRMPLAGAEVPSARRVVLRREGEEPLSEIVRHVDIDGDGDISDTNDIFEDAAALSPVSPRMRKVEIAVAKATSSIDTTHDENLSSVTSLDQLLAPQPTSIVVSYEPTDIYENWVAQQTVGGL
ncbi:hypothetical protein BH11MYX1_BH11MYX1_31110 [soil metagenome]